MEKRRPAYNLDDIKQQFSIPGKVSATGTALKSAAALGFDKAGIVDVIQNTKVSHFYKSMTSHADHKIWQDVYHVPYDGMTLYIKFTAGIITGFTLLSFKEK